MYKLCARRLVVAETYCALMSRSLCHPLSLGLFIWHSGNWSEFYVSIHHNEVNTDKELYKVFPTLVCESVSFLEHFMLVALINLRLPNCLYKSIDFPRHAYTRSKLTSLEVRHKRISHNYTKTSLLSSTIHINTPWLEFQSELVGIS